MYIVSGLLKGSMAIFLTVKNVIKMLNVFHSSRHNFIIQHFHVFVGRSHLKPLRAVDEILHCYPKPPGLVHRSSTEKGGD